MRESDTINPEEKVTLPHDKFAICISRSQCSGGVTFAHKLGEKLGIPVYDDNIFDYAAKDHNIRSDLFVKNEDNTDFSVPIIYGAEYASSGAMITYTDNFLSNKNIHSMQSETILRLAADSSAIFLGHTADFVLRNHPNLLTVYISEPMPIRIKPPERLRRGQ